MLKTESSCIRPMGAGDLEAVLAWRNHPEVRRYMLTQHEISLDEHRQWFAVAEKDATRRLLIVEEAELPLGLVHFRGVDRGSIAEWGFYAAIGATKGAGTKLGTAALNFAFHTLELHKVCGQVLDFNEASRRFHLKLGFRQEGILRDQCLIGKTYHDLICFGLLRHEWSQ